MISGFSFFSWDEGMPLQYLEGILAIIKGIYKK